MNGKRFLVCCLAVIGTVAAGADEETGFIEMPPPVDGSYTLGSPPGSDRAWGQPETIRFLLLVSREWSRRHESEMVIRIGDISRHDGRNFPPHKTHQDGFAIDVTTRGPNICHIDHDDQEESLELARLMVHYGARQILYNHPHVIERVPEVRDWPKHDDHFHVVVDPERVPRGEGPFLVPEISAAGLRRLGRLDLTDESGEVAGPEVRWGYLARERGWQRAFRIEVVRVAEGEAMIHDSGWVDGSAETHRLPTVFEHGQTYRWRVRVRGPGEEEPSLTWQEFRIDLEAPRVRASGPEEEEEIEGNPLLTWTYEDDSEQAAYRVEIDQDRSHRRVTYATDRIEKKDGRHLFDDRLRPGKTYHWRVTVEDAHGNATSTAWRTFRTARDYRGGRWGTVTTAELNFRAGPGTAHRALGQLTEGEEVEILAREGEWLKVQVRKGGRSWIGFVHSRYIEE